jgi:molybdopterin/thiamine biosynthesis adenylyltransferase
MLADPDTVDLSNLNRQAYSEAHVGRNKALALAEVIKGINGRVKVDVDPLGISVFNAGRLVSESDVVIEMVDIGRPEITFLLHEEARKARKPLVTGLDLGEGAMTYVFDYRTPGQLSYKEFLGLDSEITMDEVRTLNPLGIAAQHVLGQTEEQFTTVDQARFYYDNLPNTRGQEILEKLPEEMRPIFQRLSLGQIDFIPQSGIAAGILGAMLAASVRQIALGRPVVTAPRYSAMNVMEAISQ